MVIPSLRVQFEAIRFLESDFRAKRRELGKSLRATRVGRNLSLRDISPRVRLSPSMISEFERGRAWSEKSVGRLIRFFEKVA